MAEPFIFIGTHAIKSGKLEEFRAALRDLVEVIEAEEPRLIAFNAYVNEDGTEAAIVQVHPDADSMEFHMQVVGKHIEASAQFLETMRIEIYGTPSSSVVAMIEHVTDVPVTVKPEGLGGFTRTTFERTPAAP